MRCVQHAAIHREVGLWCGSTAGRRRGSGDGGTARRVGQMLLFLAFVKSSKTLFPNTWHRPLILWVWGRMKESEGGRKEAGEINGEKMLLGVVWICFTPCCLDCFLFLHTAATKLGIPIGRHGNARQHLREQTLSHWSPWKKNALMRCATGGNDGSSKAHTVHWTPGSPLLRLLS